MSTLAERDSWPGWNGDFPVADTKEAISVSIELFGNRRVAVPSQLPLHPDFLQLKSRRLENYARSYTYARNKLIVISLLLCPLMMHGQNVFENGTEWREGKHWIGRYGAPANRRYIYNNYSLWRRVTGTRQKNKVENPKE